MAWILYRNPKDIKQTAEPVMQTIRLSPIIITGIDFDKEYRLAISNKLASKLFQEHDKYTAMIGNTE